MAAVLEFSDVTVRRGDAVLLDRITWVVRDGERWVVLGPNGAGKTTLLQVAAAQLHPSAGAAGVLGELLTELPSLAPHAHGALPLLVLLAPRDKRHFTPEQLAFLRDAVSGAALILL